MTESFTDLGLRPEILRALDEQGYAEPTLVQVATIPPMLQGRDVIVQAQTGTGKTAAFALPILNNLNSSSGQVQALVVTPTRELALQVAQAAYHYGAFSQASVLAVYGGQPYGRQISRLKRGVDLVVGTPGRLLDLLKKNVLDLSQVQTVILDEADEMLSMGFIEDIEALLEATPAARQTGLFSATLPDPIRRLAARYMTDPHTVTIQPEQRTVSSIDQRYYLVNEADKLAALTRLFEIEEPTSTLIFVRTRIETGDLANELTLRGFPAEAMSGELSQDERERVMSRFRDHRIAVLVATDVAARGLDIDDISHVINIGLPDDPEVYVHRIGRTGRIGKTGTAISLVATAERRRLRNIESYIRQKIEKAPLPTEADILAHREAKLVEQVRVWLRRGRCQQERELAAALAEEGYDMIEVAAAAIKLARAEEKQRPLLAVSEVVEARPRAKNGGRRRQSGRSQEAFEEGMVRLTLNRGKAHGIRVGDVVGTLAANANIPGRTIGKIQLYDQYTLVDVEEQFVGKILAKKGDYHIRKQPISVALS